MKRFWNRLLREQTVAALGLAGAGFALSCAPASAFAQFALGIAIGLPPPVAVFEAPPPPRVGYVYAPGYWAWHGDRHIWIGGRWILQRPGHYWVADRWEPVAGRWRLVQGHWAPHARKHKGWRGRH